MFQTESGIESIVSTLLSNWKDAVLIMSRIWDFPANTLTRAGKILWAIEQISGFFNSTLDMVMLRKQTKDTGFCSTMDKQGSLSRWICPPKLGLIRITHWLRGKWVRLVWPSIHWRIWKLFLKEFPLNKPRQISLVANATALVGLAMFIALAEKQGVPTWSDRFENPERYFERIHSAKYLYLSAEAIAPISHGSCYLLRRKLS